MRAFLLIILLCGIIFVSQTGLSHAETIDFNSPIPAHTAEQLLQKIIRWVIGLTGSIALVILIYSGFRYLTAGADEEKARNAKKMLWWAVLGLAVILASAGIVNSVMYALGVPEV